MELEYSFEHKGKIAYIFSNEEKKLIAKVLKPEIKKIERQIEKIENHPKNEGQVDFKEKIRNLRYFKKDIEQIISDFND